MTFPDVMIIALLNGFKPDEVLQKSDKEIYNIDKIDDTFSKHSKKLSGAKQSPISICKCTKTYF